MIQVASSERGPITRTRYRRLSQWWPSILVMGVYAFAALALYWPLGLADNTHIATCACGDSAQQMWLLALWHSQLVGGHLSFFTRAIDYPGGVNLLDNASFPLVGILMAPITGVLGPAGALALLFRLSVAVSAATFYAVLRRLDRSVVASAIGGAFYAFSPFAGMEGASHPFLVLTSLPPLIMLVAYRQFREERGGSLGAGALIGVLAVGQALIDSEMLITTIFLVAMTGVVTMVVEVAHRRPVCRHLGTAWRLAAGAAAVAFPLLAYPAWYAFDGPGHIVGRLSPPSTGINPIATLLPVSGTVVAGVWQAWRVAAVPLQHNTGYVGIGLLTVSLWIAMTSRRDPLVRSLAILGTLAWLCALGGLLVVHGAATSFPLPYALVEHVPVLQDVVVKRFTFEVDLAVAGLLAVAVDALIDKAHGWRPMWKVLAAAWVATSLVLALPAGPDSPVSLAHVNAFAGARVDALIPRGAVVLAYPIPEYGQEQAMLWQAEAGLRFLLIGGYAIHPKGDGKQTYAPTPMTPAVVWSFFINPTAPGMEDRAQLGTIRALLPVYVRDHHVAVILIDGTNRGQRRVAGLVRSVYGAPVMRDDFDVWSLDAG